MKYRDALIVCLSAFALAGCATVYEGKYDFADGWREAKVIQIGHASEIPTPQFSDCRDAALPQQLATDKFVVLSYRHLNRPRKRVVPLRPSSGVRVDELVYMNVTDCDRSLEPRSNASVRPRLE
ncbi:MAG: hypothetical protein PSV40_03000 [Polaromonas sp.]|uniref:hypothetical protein n=1 Tax=Polaromonas sp. TaxID=1869339 RepID=UPI002486F785|nr:hypothetical protein [Polaromonas sp.]MDI1268056.1 hypothetical protein [Polaromonas sp.]